VGGIAADATTVDITAGDGLKILADAGGALAAGDCIYAWFKGVLANREVIKITGVAGDTLTVVRGINARFPARAWAQNDIVHFALSKSPFDDMQQAVVDAVDEIGTAVVSLDAATTALANIADLEMTLTNKRLTLPKINEDVELTRTATDLNNAVITTADQDIGGTKNFNGTLQIGGLPVPYLETSITAASGGLTATYIKLVKVGKQVTMTWAGMPHANLATVSSAAGLIPAAYRPTNQIAHIPYHIGTFFGAQFKTITVETNGTLVFDYWILTTTTPWTADNKINTYSGSISWVTA
jgi:hypothetical protein